MRASADENNHFSTHHLTVPIENERSALCNCTLKVKISDEYTLNATEINIDTSKIDKTLADEQGGLGLSTYPCLLCTFSKDEHRDKDKVMQGFPINRVYAEGVTEGERMRVNADLSTQQDLIIKTKGWKKIPLLESEYARRGFDDLHSSESWGRWAIQIIIKLCANIYCWIIDVTLKSLYETTKQTVREKLIRLIGVDIGMDITGGQAQKLFMKINHHKIVSIVPDNCMEDFAHFLSEASFFPWCDVSL